MGERQAIRKFVSAGRYPDRPDQIKALLEQSAVEFFASRAIRDARGSGEDTRQDMVVLRDEQAQPKKRLMALLLILYQVRCNLFHGSKHYASDSDNEVMKNAATAAGCAMGHFLDLNQSQETEICD